MPSPVLYSRCVLHSAPVCRGTAFVDQTSLPLPNELSPRAVRPTSGDAVADELAIAVGVADVRCAPDAASELVTQALLGVPARVLAEAEGWRKVRLPDYEGWILATDLAAPATVSASDRVAVVTAPQTPIYEDVESEQARDTAIVTTMLPLVELGATDGRIRVALP